MKLIAWKQPEGYGDIIEIGPNPGSGYQVSNLLHAIGVRVGGFDSSAWDAIEVTICVVSDLDSIAFQNLCPLALAGEAIVMVSFDSPGDWNERNNHWWRALQGFGRVRYVQAPERDGRGPSLPEAVELAMAAPYSHWDLPLRVAQAGAITTSNLRHIQSRALADPTSSLYADWKTEGERLFGPLSDQELARKVESEEAPSPFAGEHFEVIAVDCEGTVIDSQGNLREDVLAQAESLAQSTGLPLILWTGGVLEDISRKLCPHLGDRLPYLLAEKAAFRKASVSVAFDDEPQETFSQTYGITVGTFHQV